MSASSPSNGVHNKEIRSLPLAYHVEDSDASATRLVLALLPEWGQADGKIEFIRFKDGITNTVKESTIPKVPATKHFIAHESRQEETRYL